MSTNKDWIEWQGGECPVPDNTPIQAEWRAGKSFRTVCPQEFRWGHQDSESDIVAYRVIINPFLH